MEYIVTVLVVKLLQTGDQLALLVVFRISVRCKHNTDCRIILELQIDLIQLAVDAGVDHINDIVLHTRKNNLCLRIAETCVVLEYLWTVCGHHETDEKNTDEISSLCFHGIHGWLIYLLFTELLNLLCIERAWGESSHSTGI